MTSDARCWPTKHVRHHSCKCSLWGHLINIYIQVPKKQICSNALEFKGFLGNKKVMTNWSFENRQITISGAPGAPRAQCRIGVLCWILVCFLPFKELSVDVFCAFSFISEHGATQSYISRATKSLICLRKSFLENSFLKGFPLFLHIFHIFSEISYSCLHDRNPLYPHVTTLNFHRPGTRGRGSHSNFGGSPSVQLLSKVTF